MRMSRREKHLYELAKKRYPHIAQHNDAESQQLSLEAVILANRVINLIYDSHVTLEVAYWAIQGANEAVVRQRGYKPSANVISEIEICDYSALAKE